MAQVASTQFQNGVGKYLQQAQDEPVIIEKSGRPAAVLLSIAEYEQLMHLRRGLTADQERLLRLGSEMQALLQKYQEAAPSDTPVAA